MLARCIHSLAIPAKSTILRRVSQEDVCVAAWPHRRQRARVTGSRGKQGRPLAWFALGLAAWGKRGVALTGDCFSKYQRLEKKGLVESRREVASQLLLRNRARCLGQGRMRFAGPWICMEVCDGYPTKRRCGGRAVHKSYGGVNFGLRHEKSGVGSAEAERACADHADKFSTLCCRMLLCPPQGSKLEAVAFQDCPMNKIGATGT